jgi:hypothetical protein
MDLVHGDHKSAGASKNQEAARQKLGSESSLTALAKGFLHEVSQPVAGIAQIVGLKEPQKTRHQESQGTAFAIGAFAGQAADFVLATAIARRIPGCASSMLAATVGGGLLGFVSPLASSENTLADRFRKGLVGAATVAVLETTGSRNMRFASTTGLLHHALHESFSGALAGVATVQLDSKFKTGQWVGCSTSLEAALGWGITGGVSTVLATGLAKSLEKGAKLLPEVDFNHKMERSKFCFDKTLNYNLKESIESSIQRNEREVTAQIIGRTQRETGPMPEAVLGGPPSSHEKLELKPKSIDLRQDMSGLIEKISTRKEPILEVLSGPAVEKEFVVHKIRGCSTEICVAIELLPEIEKIRELRTLGGRLSEFDAVEFHRVIEKWTPEYASTILPEQLPLFLNELPNQKLIKEIYLLPQRSGDGMLAYALSPSKIIAWEFNQSPEATLRWMLAHEWAHLADFQGTWKGIFELAAKYEEHGYNARDYAKTNLQENWAVHLGEELMHRDPDFACVLAEKAPFRAYVLARALKEQIANNGSSFASASNASFARRADYVQAIAEEEIRKVLPSLFNGNKWRNLAGVTSFLQALAEKREDLAEQLISRQFVESWLPPDQQSSQQPLSKLLSKMHDRVRNQHCLEMVASSMPAIAVKGIEELASRGADPKLVQSLIEQTLERGEKFAETTLRLFEFNRIDSRYLPGEAVASLVLHSDADWLSQEALSVLLSHGKEQIEKWSPAAQDLIFERGREIVKAAGNFAGEAERKIFHAMYDRTASWMASPSRRSIEFLIEQLHSGNRLSDSAMLIVSHVKDPEARLEALKVLQMKIDAGILGDHFGVWLKEFTHDLPPVAREEVLVEAVNQQALARRRKIFEDMRLAAKEGDEAWILNAFRRVKMSESAA